MQSTVVSPGLRLTASHTVDTAALGGSRIIHQMKPCCASLMDPASPLHERAGENPQPHTSHCQMVLSGHISPTEMCCPFPLSPKQHSNLCMTALLEETTKTHSTLFREAQNRSRRESKKETNFYFKRCQHRGLRRTRRHVYFTPPPLSTESPQAHSSLFISFI